MSDKLKLFRMVMICLALSCVGESSFAQQSPKMQSGLMTVAQLDALIEKGEVGRLAAVSYVQGVVDGMLAMDSLRQKERGSPPDFCLPKGIRHPAFQTVFLVHEWKREGVRPMSTLAVDMVLSFLSAQYSCKNESKRKD